MSCEKLIIKNQEIARVLNLEHLIYIKVEDYLLTFSLKDNESFVCCKSLKEISELLPENFIQINRNCIVNVSKIVTLEKKNRKIVLSDGSIHIASHRLYRGILIKLSD
jgi:DNA-binding LytR/AlgR family response regulator